MFNLRQLSSLTTARRPPPVFCEKRGGSLRRQVENENGNFSGDVAPLQQMTQDTKAKPDQPGSPSLPTVSEMRQTKASTNLNSTTEHAKNEIPMEEWFSPRWRMNTPKEGLSI